MKQRVVLIDMDDTLCNQTDNWLTNVNEQYKTNIQRSDLKIWHKEHALKSLIPELTTSDVYRMYDKPGFFRNLPIMPGAFEALEEMKRIGWRAVIVTSLPRAEHRSGQIIQEKLEWVKEYLDGVIGERDFIATHKKYFVNGDVLIDDAEHNLQQYPGHTIAFDQPWNREVETTARVYSWDEVVDICEKLFTIKSIWPRRLNER